LAWLWVKRAVPVCVIFPGGCTGVPAEGLTSIPEKLIMEAVPDASCEATVIVILEAVGKTVTEPADSPERVRAAPLPLPLVFATVTVTAAAGLNSNPEGALKTIVPPAGPI
jgi:hypothetical protein